MAIKLSLSTKSDSQGRCEILIRYKSGVYAARGKSGVYSAPDWFDFVAGNNSEMPNKRKKNVSDEMKEAQTFHESQKIELSKINTAISEALKNPELNRNCSKWLLDCLDKYYLRGEYAPKEAPPKETQPFFDVLDEYLRKRKLSKSRDDGFMTAKRAMQRFELFVSATEAPFAWDLDTITSDTIDDFEDFLRNEHILHEKHREIYDNFPASINPQKNIKRPRGTNTINALFDKLSAFFNWCLDKEKTKNKPFRNYERKPDLYGTPYYITIDERNKIYKTNLSHVPDLAIQRDIFVFQCLIGCRLSDLLKMTKKSVIKGAIEYIPRKTKDGRPITVRVPLIPLAKEILEKYADYDGGALLPFVPKGDYNKAIKEIFTLSKITRNVTVLNPTTREEEKRRINEIASSHLARRTFIGNLYKKVKDPNLIGALSGHIEGSKAFARYRTIDKDMKKETVNLLMEE
jgi:integrase